MSNLSLSPIPTIKNFSSYIQYVMNIPNLDVKEERYLLNEYKINNCIQSAQSLVMSQLKTVIRVANSYKNYGLPTEDLVQEGNIGLMKAVKNYDIKQEVRLYSYVLVWIKAEIQNYIIKNWKLVKIATTKNFKKLFFNFRKTQKEMIDNGIPSQETYKYISNKLEVSEQEVRDIESYFISDDVTIIQDNNSDDNYTYTPLALIESTTPDMIVEELHDNEVNNKLLQKGLKTLNDKQKAIIKYRFFDDDKKTHKEIGDILHISSERVRQIEVQAINKLKDVVLI